MSKTKIIRPSSDAIAMMMQTERMSGTYVYNTVNSYPSIMDYTSAHVMDYISYLLSLSVVFTLKYILGLSFFYLVVIKNVKMMHLMLCILPFSHHFKNIVTPVRSKRALYHIYNIIWCWSFFRKNNYFLPNCLDVHNFI